MNSTALHQSCTNMAREGRADRLRHADEGRRCAEESQPTPEVQARPMAMHVKGAETGHVKGAVPTCAGNDKGKDGRAQRCEPKGECVHCGGICHREPMCPRKGEGANAVSGQGSWSAMLHDEPHTFSTTPNVVNSASGAEPKSDGTAAGANSQHSLQVVTKEGASIPG